ncbi:GNAT family acetyltransferase [Flavobacterium rivuli WB 3.3-2 = DSM 21788]|uniref:GNAT family acetyltransferase n=1 Tax=Flavobacterium rivuli WB 3.3-2 = DSM 21788 TaxID=1121895 RepID=A0A0A2M9Y9_9FLAO|nr:GNAT family N-acetyltransferase [Flavobacterium rivuli]KGO88461.1 GNAT family acetyltransferase [Flavobacterium rivuli WB 3.3-2 = DSM 21788]
MEIIIKENGGKGFAMARENEKRAGMMSYSIAGAELIIIDHTEVEPDFNGKGVGKQLLYAIVEMAREKNIKIIPLCPFAASVFKKADDIKDVLKA